MRMKYHYEPISVIIPVYNYPHHRSLHVTIEGLIRQQIDLEIIISEQSILENKQYEKVASRYGVKYVHSLPDIINGKIYSNIGRVRNVGAAVSTGEFLYLTDADVLLFDKIYLRELLLKKEKQREDVYCRPKMLRLKSSSFSSFRDDYVNRKTIDVDIGINDHCLVEYDNGKIILNSDGEEKEIMHNHIYVCDHHDYLLAISLGDNICKLKRFIWKPVLHWGATFCSFRDFVDAGGYSEKYLNWGFEDDDFHFKLSGIRNIQCISDVFPRFFVIHFEHDRDYYNRIYRKNEAYFQKRVFAGSHKSIDVDYRNKSTFFSMWINDNFEQTKKYFPGFLPDFRKIN